MTSSNLRATTRFLEVGQQCYAYRRFDDGPTVLPIPGFPVILVAGKNKFES